MTGVSTSSATALAWMSSIWGCRYDNEAKAYDGDGEPTDIVAFVIRDAPGLPNS